MKTNHSKTTPVWEQRFHAIRISVWRNEDGNGRAFFNTSVARRYQQGTEWRETSQLTGPGDVILAIEGLRMALDFVRAQESSGRLTDSSDE